MAYFGSTAVIVRHLRKATNVALEESRTLTQQNQNLSNRSIHGARQTKSPSSTGHATRDDVPPDEHPKKKYKGDSGAYYYVLILTTWGGGCKGVRVRAWRVVCSFRFVSPL